MSKKNMSQKRAARQQMERAALNNIINVFLLGLAAECFLFIVFRGYVGGSVNSLLVWDKILRVIVWGGLALAAGGGIAALCKRRNTKFMKVAGLTALGGLFMSITSWIALNFFDTGVVAMCIAVPVLTVLGLIYFLYQHECFLSSLLLSGAIFTVWVCSKGLNSYWGTLVTVCSIAVLAVLALITVAVAILKKNGGKLRGEQFFSNDCNYLLVYLVCVLCAAVILAALFVPSLSFYLIWALIVALFAELAYYTTKMM